MVSLPKRQRSITALIGCGCFSLVLVCSGFITAIVLFTSGIMRKSEPYQVAVHRAEAEPEVQRLLGTPIHEGWFTSGSINISGSQGSADLSIPLKGPKGKASLYVGAHRDGGRWVFDRMVVTGGVAAAHDIDLIGRDGDEGKPDEPGVEHL